MFPCFVCVVLGAVLATVDALLHLPATEDQGKVRPQQKQNHSQVLQRKPNRYLPELLEMDPQKPGMCQSFLKAKLQVS